MYLINARLRAPEIDGRPAPPEGRMPAPELRRLLMALARPQDQLEHVYSEASPVGVDFGLFLRQLTLDAAEGVAIRLFLRLLGTAPELDGWSLTDCGTDLTLALIRLEAFDGEACQRPAIAAR
ncbi:hypothetical protein [Streptosporangium subroseum]|uniref:hypothetical protein n=1 Tax=Streptosporangium subroseum TaxID=106412 RepID=UPI00308E5DC0|nr:hypothetical protein OHB15_15360 [Streptosporangium subroseum]